MPYNKVFVILLPLFAVLLNSCEESIKPIEAVTVKRIIDGKVVEDTLTYTVPAFKFVNQFGDTITEKEVAGKFLLVDFFFANCPSICPKMKSQMLRVYEKYGKRDDFLILSHTIDPKRDTVEALFSYAQKLGIDKNWYFLTGDKEKLFEAADKYLIAASEDPQSPGGFAHSGNFVLADKNGRIRGYYDGTNTQATDKLIKDLNILFKERE